jgi:hypothetical protein
MFTPGQNLRLKAAVTVSPWKVREAAISWVHFASRLTGVWPISKL